MFRAQFTGVFPKECTYRANNGEYLYILKKCCMSFVHGNKEYVKDFCFDKVVQDRSKK